MTTERDVPIVDESLRSHYRELADERAPDHLNEKVLRQARKSATPHYGRSRAWTRPLAWAATIALSVALVLELTQTPVPEPSLPAASAPTVTEELGRADERETAGDSASAFEAQDQDLLRRASEMADVTNGDNRSAGTAEEDATSAANRALPAAEPSPGIAEARLQGLASGAATAGCDKTVRATAQTWLDCIVALEQAGQSADAATERQLFQERFPDIELPPPSVSNE